MTAAVLQVSDLAKAFRGLRAVDGVSLAIQEGEVRAIIGPNGAGKTTLFNLISGLLPPDRGQVWFRGRNVTGWTADRLVKLGLVRTFQITSIFPGVAVRENVCLALRSRHGFNYGFLQSARRVDAQIAREAERLLEALGLNTQGAEKAAELSHGDQRVLEVAIGLALNPALLLLDEPTAGMSPSETARVTHLIAELRRQTTIIIIEHDTEVVMKIADAITVLHQGKVLAEGRPGEIQRDDGVRAAYLGGYERA